jgi:branched-subunit amino acid transport protein
LTSIWYPIIIVGILTFLTRLSFIVLSNKIKLHPKVQGAFRYIPIAVLSAIIFPELFQFHDANIILAFPRIIAGLFAILIAARTRNIILTITGGMLILYIMQYIIDLF